MRKIEDMNKCEYGACRAKATDIVYSRNTNTVIFCCEKHADIVIDEHSPEYRECCPNCGCMFGVN